MNVNNFVSFHCRPDLNKLITLEIHMNLIFEGERETLDNVYSNVIGQLKELQANLTQLDFHVSSSKMHNITSKYTK